ncbi:hypothetical protein [Enterobacter cloacae]|uniref:hypothetical protein n=1 Tax=Enterobacter cloacae TaxID=550 RepID=UPI002FFBCC1A
MKLVTGVVPVALGVAMALISGMAKAEDNAAQPQPLTNGVRAQTTLPSVGHRPVLKNFDVITKKHGFDYKISTPKKVSSGSRLFVVAAPEDADSDPLMPELTCRVFKVKDSGEESALTDEVSCTGGPENSVPVSVTSDMSGDRVAVEVYATSDIIAAQLAGYTPEPAKSLVHRVLSSPVVPFQVARARTGVVEHLPDRKDPSSRYDDEFRLKTAFTNARMEISMEGGTSGLVFRERNDLATIESVINDTVNISFKDDLRYSPENELIFDVNDDAGNTATFSVSVNRFYYHPQDPYTTKHYPDAKAVCERYSHKLAFDFSGLTSEWNDPSVTLLATNKGERYFDTDGTLLGDGVSYSIITLKKPFSNGQTGKGVRNHYLCEKKQSQ